MLLRLFEANWLKYSQRYYPDQIYPLLVSFNQLLQALLWKENSVESNFMSFCNVNKIFRRTFRGFYNIFNAINILYIMLENGQTF